MTKKRNITVDIGNTRIKSGEFVDDELTTVEFWDSLIQLYTIKKENTSFWTFCSVRGNKYEIDQVFNESDHLVLDHETPLPIKLDYETPETLGMDRVAALVGGQSLYPNKNIMVIDVGTCNTYDILDANGIFKGGVIAPGFKMRMKAMSQFTKALPDISGEWEDLKDQYLGKNTRECLKSGSYQATILEIEGFIGYFRQHFEDLTILMTGGDASYFESKLKGPIFARSNLVLRGLNSIRHFNNA
ncbi:MAG: type III pantothenate kinase [Bacteroidota bacterium]